MKPLWEEYTGKNDLFISAGAGTGKTHTISSIYVSLFDRAFRRGQKLGVENVVTITYTRKAAREMKKKIVEMIEEKLTGENAHVWHQLLSSMIFAWISTIDSFANRILTESGLLVGVDPGFRISSESRMRYSLHRAVLWTLSEHIDLMEPLLSFYDIDQIVSKLTEAIVHHRYNLLTCKSITRIDFEFPFHNNTEEEKLLKKAIDNFHELFLHAYEAYLQELDREKLMDFTEVLMKLRRILKEPEHEWLRERYRNQFKYIIVDEFQDTNFLQKEIIDLLRGPETKIIYVGDAKQSIYRFRGAEVEVFSQAKKEIEASGGSLHQLSVNFRSHPDIVEFNNRLFEKIFTGGKDYAPLYSRLAPLHLEGVEDSRKRVNLLLIEKPSDEPEVVAEFIESIVGREFEFVRREKRSDEVVLIAERRPMRYSDIAVLYRKGRGTLQKFTRVFEERRIPYYVVGETGFFDLPEIEGLIAFLKLLNNPLDDSAMVSALLSPVVGLNLDDLVLLKQSARSSMIGNALFYALKDFELEGEKGKRLALFREVLRRYIPLKAMMKPSELLEAVVEELNYEPRLARFDTSGRKVANLRKLLATARNLDETGISLRELMRRLRHFGPEDEEQAALESEETDAVQMMTVHKAKGLEFPVVIVIDTSWSVRETKGGLIFHREDCAEPIFTLSPSEISKEVENDETFLGKAIREDMEREIEEEKRTLYVALTRAVDLLVLTFAINPGRNKGKAYWRDLLTRHLVFYDGKKVGLAEDFVDLMDIISPPFNTADKSALPQKEEGTVKLSTQYVRDLKDSSYKEYIAPTTLELPAENNMMITDVELTEKMETTDVRDLGVLAHEILEAVGNKTRLKSMMNARPASVDALRFSEDDLKEVWNVLSSLLDHELIKEIESSYCLNEFELARPFGKHILYGRLDKVVKTPTGWKIVDFKFSSSSFHSEQYEFQMKFYLYLARDLFHPLLGAFIFYLKDGVVKKFMLSDDEVSEFENQLRERIKRYHEQLKKSG